jgi:hypothetical protein
VGLVVKKPYFEKMREKETPLLAAGILLFIVEKRKGRW